MATLLSRQFDSLKYYMACFTITWEWFAQLAYGSFHELGAFVKPDSPEPFQSFRSEYTG